MRTSIIVLLAGLALVASAPAAPQQQPQPAAPAAAAAAPGEADILKPLTSQMRNLIQDAQKAIESIGKQADSAKDRILLNARSLIANPGKQDRALFTESLKDRAIALTNQVRNEAVQLLEKSLAALSPVQSDVRSSVLGVRDLAKMVESKYLTADGQELLNSALYSAAKAVLPN